MKNCKYEVLKAIQIMNGKDIGKSVSYSEMQKQLPNCPEKNYLLWLCEDKSLIYIGLESKGKGNEPDTFFELTPKAIDYIADIESQKRMKDLAINNINISQKTLSVTRITLCVSIAAIVISTILYFCK